MNAARRILRPSWRFRNVWAAGRPDPRCPSVAALSDMLEGEMREIDKRVRATIRRATLRRRITFPTLVPMVDLLRVGAWCRPSGADDGFRVEISAGTVLAIDDLTLFSATMASFLIPSRSAMAVVTPGKYFRLDQPLQSDGQYVAHPGRFYDYATTSQDVLDPGTIVFAQPQEGWRLAQAAMVAELAIAWILFHEYSHWGLAHVDLLAPEDRTVGFADHPDAVARRFSFDPGDPPVRARDVAVGRVLEIHADTAAFHLLVDLARSERGPCARFNRAMATDALAANPLRLTNVDHPQIVRLCLTAAAIACIVLDGGRRKERGGASHPSPSARYMNLHTQSPMLVPGMLGEVDGHIVVVDDEIEGFTARDLGEMMALASLDAQLVAGITSLARLRTSRPDALDPRTWHRAPWRADMRRQWRTDAEDPELRSRAGKELDRLPLDDPALNTALRAAQYRRFGSIFDIYANGL